MAAHRAPQRRNPLARVLEGVTAGSIAAFALGLLAVL